MPQIDVAYIREQGQDMIIAPLDRSFDQKTSQQQQAAVAEIQMAATSAGLKGTDAVVWPSSAAVKFIAPRPWHPFFQSIDIRWVIANLNRSLSW